MRWGVGLCRYGRVSIMQRIRVEAFVGIERISIGPCVIKFNPSSQVCSCSVLVVMILPNVTWPIEVSCFFSQFWTLANSWHPSLTTVPSAIYPIAIFDQNLMASIGVEARRDRPRQLNLLVYYGVRLQEWKVSETREMVEPMIEMGQNRIKGIGKL